METKYIKPQFRITNSYKDLLNYSKENPSYLLREFNKNGLNIDLENILDHNLVFIVAEPGQGKSRLIKELQKTAPHGAYVVDFKTKPANLHLTEWLNNKDIGKDTNVLFMDALDEAPARDIRSTIYSLTDYIQKHPKTKFIVSCRIHYFSKFQDSFEALKNAEYLFINPLSRREAREFIKSLGVNNETIEILFNSLSHKQSQGGSVLQNPRYLEMIAKKAKKPDFNANQLNRSSLFASFISGALLIEDAKSGHQLAEYKQRFLEHLALTMQLAQVNEISTDEFVTFMDRATSDAKLILGNVEIESIYEHSLLTKDIEGKIYFTNTEIQEYLAAKYITRMANPTRKAFTLAFDHNMRQLIPSWYNAVSFLIDEIPEIARHIIDLKSNRMILDMSTELLVTGVTSKEMSQNDKNYIFDYVWSTNTRQANFIDRNVSFNLAHYANTEQISSFTNYFLKMDDTESSNTVLLNHIILCGNMLLLSRYKAESSSNVIDKLLRLAKDTSSTTVAYNAISALINTGDNEILNQLLPLADSSDDIIFGAIQTFAYELDRTSTTAIDLYINGMKRNDLYRSRLGLEELDTPEGIGYFLSKLSSDKELVIPTIDHNRLFAKEESKFINNLKKHWKDDWLTHLKQFILLAFSVEYGHYAERSALVSKIIKFIADRDPDYFNELFTQSIHPDKHKNHFLLRTCSSLAEIMPISAVDQVATLVSRSDDNKWLYWRILTNVTHSDNPNKRAIEKKARKLLPNEFNQYDRQTKEQQDEYDNNVLTAQFNRALEQIDVGLENGSIKALWDSIEIVINYLKDSNPREKLSYSKADLDYIWEKSKEKILEIYDTSKIDFTITKRDGGDTSHEISGFVDLIISAIIFGYLTHQKDLGVYKKKILQVLPYMWEYQTIDVLENIELDEDDISIVLSEYKNINSDKAQHLPNNLIELANSKKITKAVPILHEIVMSTEFPTYIRNSALNVCETLSPDKAFLQKVLKENNTSSQSSEQTSLAHAVDNLLISKYEEASSIQRRFNLLKSRAFDCPSHPNGVAYSIDNRESELHHKIIAKPIMSLSGKEYVSNFLDLLYESFTIHQKGDGWSRYASYLWEICTSYFNNISATKDISILNDIRETISKFPSNITADYLGYFNETECRFLEQMSPKKPFASTIHTVNQLNTIDDRIITTNEELIFEVDSLISDLERWINKEGVVLAKGSKAVKREEEDAQINIALRFHNLLLQKYGSDDIKPRIERESQSTDGTRTDFYIYYGFLGPVLVELKLSTHSDLLVRGDQRSKKSFISMEKYMEQFNAVGGVLLVCRHNSTNINKFNKIITNTTKYYGSIPRVRVKGL